MGFNRGAPSMGFRHIIKKGMGPTKWMKGPWKWTDEWCKRGVRVGSDPTQTLTIKAPKLGFLHSKQKAFLLSMPLSPSLSLYLLSSQLSFLQQNINISK